MPARRIALAILGPLALAGPAAAQAPAESLPPVALAPGLTAADLEARLAQFAPVELAFDASLLSPADRAVVRKLVEASDALHEVFLLQVWRGNVAYRARLAATTDPEIEPARAIGRGGGTGIAQVDERHH